MKEQSSSKGFAVLSTASIVCKVLSLVYLPIQTYLVHDSGNGVISAGFKLYLFIYTLTNAGLPVVISKFVSQYTAIGDYRSADKIFKTATRLILFFGIISTLLTFFASGLLDAWCGMKTQSILMFMVISPTFLFTSVSSSLRGYFQGRHNMTPTAISQIIEQIFNSVLTVVFEVMMCRYAVSLSASKAATTGYVAAGSAAATMAAAFCSAVFLCFTYFIVSKKQRRLELRQQAYDGPVVEMGYIYSQILKFLIPALISCVATSAIDLIDTNSCVKLLAPLFGDDRAKALFGIYSTKYQRLMTLATMFMAPLVTAMIPALSSALARNKIRYFKYKIRQSYKLIFIVIMPIISGLTFLAQPIIKVLFLRDYEGSLMIILGTWIAILMSVQAIQSGVLISLNQPIIAPINMIVGMSVKIVCNYLLLPIPSINIYGALIGNSVAYIIAILLNQYYINAQLRTRLHSWRYMVVPAITSIIMGAACFAVYAGLNALLLLITGKFLVANDVAVFITIPFGGLLYFTLMLKTGGISTTDLTKLPMGGKLTQLLQRVPFLRKDISLNRA